MNGELLKSTGYASTITGAAFTVEITFNMLRIWLADYKRLKAANRPALNRSEYSLTASPNSYSSSKQT